MKCQNCYKEKELIYCKDCYNQIIVDYLNIKMRSDMAEFFDMIMDIKEDIKRIKDKINLTE